MGNADNAVHREPWNKSKIVGQKAPFNLKDIWALYVRLRMKECARELAFFNLGIDSKLRGCDLVVLKVRDMCHDDQVASVTLHHSRMYRLRVIRTVAGDAQQGLVVRNLCQQLRLHCRIAYVVGGDPHLQCLGSNADV
jgi:hypothetical protein